MEDKDYEGMKTDGSYNIVMFKKGKESLIPVYEYANHHEQRTPFGIVNLRCGNLQHGTKDPVVVVTGNFRKPYEQLGIDPVSGKKHPIYFVVGDIIVPAVSINEYQYQALLLPNLPGGVNFFVSLNRMAPASQVMKLNFPYKTSRNNNKSGEDCNPICSPCKVRNVKYFGEYCALICTMLREFIFLKILEEDIAEGGEQTTISNNFLSLLV
ncbi:hypothetical protein MKW98_002866 [Papaver atlanticum]|uniref:Uncharacterized protein n=1 Tax=Papaver atlanticum TaxID=357466 RepID=A0AAD4SV78_9MAGN|nr:hypothetical protein MKW98_002866 [Papaver atlanticum]